jgi:hypothetical protein
MSNPPDLTGLVHCETCGQGYTVSVERCPRCASNQRQPALLRPDFAWTILKSVTRAPETGAAAMNVYRML